MPVLKRDKLKANEKAQEREKRLAERPSMEFRGDRWYLEMGRVPAHYVSYQDDDDHENSCEWSIHILEDALIVDTPEETVTIPLIAVQDLIARMSGNAPLICEAPVHAIPEER